MQVEVDSGGLVFAAIVRDVCCKETTGGGRRLTIQICIRIMSQSLHPLIDTFFESNVLQADGPVFVDFWEPRCRACQATRPDLDRLELHLGDRGRVISLNVNSYPDLAHTFDVAAVPTLLAFREGDVTGRLEGARKIGAFVNRVTETVSMRQAA
jgi:thioredoxin 1